MEKKLHFAQLDSLRFVAFFLVFWQHINQYLGKDQHFFNNESFQFFINQFPPPGGIGVHIFFVISGFLITFLLIREEDSTGKINVPYFYLRRILRIWPLYYLVMLLGMFVLPNVAPDFAFNGNYATNLLFLNNFDVFGQAPNIAIAWSVAIEEQFYLCWPLIFIIFRNKKVLLIVSSLLFLFSIVFIILYPSIEKYHTFGNLNYLMIGCIGAIIYSRYEEKIKKLKTFSPSHIIYVILLAIVLMILSAFSPLIRFGSFLYLAALFGLPLCYLYIVINLVIRKERSTVSFISRQGKYTYGMYLYHPMVIIFTKLAFDQFNLTYFNNLYGTITIGSLSLTATMTISYLSYEYFEKHILNFKNRFSLVKTRT